MYIIHILKEQQSRYDRFNRAITGGVLTVRTDV